MADPQQPGADDDAGDPSDAGEAARPPIEVTADPRMLAQVHGRFRPDIARRHGLPQYTSAGIPFHLDPVDWRTGFLSVRDGGAPLGITEMMSEMTPQAQLRDLFRPVYESTQVGLDRHELPLDPGGREGYREVHAALVRPPLPVITRSIEHLTEHRAAWRAFVESPWSPFLRDDEPRKKVFVII